MSEPVPGTRLARRGRAPASHYRGPGISPLLEKILIEKGSLPAGAAHLVVCTSCGANGHRAEQCKKKSEAEYEYEYEYEYDEEKSEHTES